MRATIRWPVTNPSAVSRALSACRQRSSPSSPLRCGRANIVSAINRITIADAVAIVTAVATSTSTFAPEPTPVRDPHARRKAAATSTSSPSAPALDARACYLFGAAEGQPHRLAAGGKLSWRVAWQRAARFLLPLRAWARCAAWASRQAGHVLVPMIAQCSGAHAKLIGQGAQLSAGTEALVNRGAHGMMANRAHGLHSCSSSL
jgi:hypothetical protein